MDLTRIPVSVPIVAEAQPLRVGRSLHPYQASPDRRGPSHRPMKRHTMT